MTAAMLATYPELFAGGAIIAGLPYGAAANVLEALEAMRSAPLRRRAPGAMRCAPRRITGAMAENFHLAWRARHHRERQQCPGQCGAMGRPARLAAGRRQAGDWWTVRCASAGTSKLEVYTLAALGMARPSIRAMWEPPALSFWTRAFPPAAASPTSGAWLVPPPRGQSRRQSRPRQPCPQSKTS